MSCNGWTNGIVMGGFVCPLTPSLSSSHRLPFPRTHEFLVLDSTQISRLFDTFYCVNNVHMSHFGVSKPGGATMAPPVAG